MSRGGCYLSEYGPVTGKENLQIYKIMFKSSTSKSFLTFSLIFKFVHSLVDNYKYNKFWANSPFLSVICRLINFSRLKDRSWFKILKRPCRHLLKGRPLDLYHFWPPLNFREKLPLSTFFCVETYILRARVLVETLDERTKWKSVHFSSESLEKAPHNPM